MKKLRIKLAVAAVLGALSITPAMSAQLVLDSTGNVLMGINGVQVGTAQYNVTFGDTATTAQNKFAFSTSDEAIQATRELMNLLDVTGVAGAYGDGAETSGGRSAPTLNGVSDNRFWYWVLTWYSPTQFVYDYDYTKASGAVFGPSGVSDRRYGSPELFDISGAVGATYNSAAVMEIRQTHTNATWKLTSAAPASSVPEPTSLALMGLGVLGYTASRRKSKCPTQPDAMATTA